MICLLLRLIKRWQVQPLTTAMSATEALPPLINHRSRCIWVKCLRRERYPRSHCSHCWCCSRSSCTSQCVAHATAHQPFDIGDRPDVMQLSSSVNECGQPSRIQGLLGVFPAMSTPTAHPWVLQTGGSTWSLPGVLLENRRHKVPRRLAHVTEVFIWEAKVQAADVDTRFLWRFVQKWGNAAKHDISQHTHAPHVCGYGDWGAANELRCRELWVAKQEVYVAAVGRELHGVAQVNELNAREWRVEVHQDVFRLQGREILRHNSDIDEIDMWI